MLQTIAVLLLAAPPADWPQWRGPNRDGHATGPLPAKWPADAPPPRWTATVGAGYSGPVVAGGRVYAMGRAEGQESCLCFDAATGKKLWAVRYPSDFVPPDPTAGKGPASTPTVDRDRVYFLGLGGVLHCLNAQTGAVLWKHDFAAEYWGKAKDALGGDAWMPPCGCATGPLAVGDTVVVSVGGKTAGAFVAFDRGTGAVVWTALPDRGSYAGPVLAGPGGVRQMIGFTGTRLVGLHPDTRTVLWEQPFKAGFEQTILTPVVWNDLVVVGGEARATFALRIAADGDGAKATKAWSNDDLKAYTTTPVAVGNRLVGHDVRGDRLVCLDLKSGETVWASNRVGRYFSLAAVGDTVLALNNGGELYAFSASADEFAATAKWTVSTDKGTWSHLAVADGRLYVKDKSKLLCYDLAG